LLPCVNCWSRVKYCAIPKESKLILKFEFFDGRHNYNVNNNEDRVRISDLLDAKRYGTEYLLNILLQRLIFKFFFKNQHFSLATA
jgi:hypothetical protein